MYYRLLHFLNIILYFISLSFATPMEEVVQARAAYPEPMHLMRNIYPRQEAPTSYTTSRAGNTDFAPPQTITPSSTTPGSAITSRESNNQIVASSSTGPAPPLVTTDSRSANTQAVGPSTVSSGLAAPTGAMRMDIVLGGMVVGIAGIV